MQTDKNTIAKVFKPLKPCDLDFAEPNQTVSQSEYLLNCRQGFEIGDNIQFIQVGFVEPLNETGGILCCNCYFEKIVNLQSTIPTFSQFHVSINNKFSARISSETVTSGTKFTYLKHKSLVSFCDWCRHSLIVHCGCFQFDKVEQFACLVMSIHLRLFDLTQAEE